LQDILNEQSLTNQTVDRAKTCHFLCNEYHWALRIAVRDLMSIICFYFSY